MHEAKTGRSARRNRQSTIAGDCNFLLSRLTGQVGRKSARTQYPCTTLPTWSDRYLQIITPARSRICNHLKCTWNVSKTHSILDHKFKRNYYACGILAKNAQSKSHHEEISVTLKFKEFYKMIGLYSLNTVIALRNDSMLNTLKKHESYK